jgi:hypothetical protein
MDTLIRRRQLPGLALAVAIAGAVPAAYADSARVGFGEFDITCEADIWAVSRVLERLSVDTFEMLSTGAVLEFVLSLSFDPTDLSLDEVIADLRLVGFEAVVLSAAAS